MRIQRYHLRFVPVLLLAAGLMGCGMMPAEGPATDEAAAEAPHPHDDDEILVLDPPADYLRHLSDLGLEIIDINDLPGMGKNLYHLRIKDGAHPFDARDRHRGRFPDVVVDAHHHYEHHAAKVDKTYTARKASNWQDEKKACGKGLKVGVVDGVVDVKHKAFKGTMITYRSFHLKGQKLAKSGHGTAVTAVIAGRGAWGGLLPGVQIVAANVFHKGKKDKPVGSAKSIVRAIDWMVQMKVPVTNFSIGGGKNALIAAAVDHAASKGMIMIASSGNGGPFSKKKSYPGAYPQVIAITAVDRFDRSARFATSGEYIDFAAPGVDIWTAVPGGGKAMSGTSFAAPIVTAFAAAARERLGLKAADGVRNYLKKHARDRGKPGRDRYTGWGIVQLPPVC